MKDVCSEIIVGEERASNEYGQMAFNEWQAKYEHLTAQLRGKTLPEPPDMGASPPRMKVQLSLYYEFLLQSAQDRIEAERKAQQIIQEYQAFSQEKQKLGQEIQRLGQENQRLKTKISLLENSRAALERSTNRQKSRTKPPEPMLGIEAATKVIGEFGSGNGFGHPQQSPSTPPEYASQEIAQVFMDWCKSGGATISRYNQFSARLQREIQGARIDKLYRDLSLRSIEFYETDRLKSAAEYWAVTHQGFKYLLPKPNDANNFRDWHQVFDGGPVAPKNLKTFVPATLTQGTKASFALNQKGRLG